MLNKQANAKLPKTYDLSCSKTQPKLDLLTRIEVMQFDLATLVVQKHLLLGHIFKYKSINGRNGLYNNSLVRIPLRLEVVVNLKIKNGALDWVDIE